MTIHVLDELTINQMAAGEVIENTSSVIKELVENSLDAHATSIEVEVQSGGRSYIRVSDNGDGILFSEVPKAILRHATSKLVTLSDLEHLQTLGFRGEALASIASISKLSITTAPKAPEGAVPNGSFFVSEGGKTVTHVTVYREKGTSIEVKDLFFNTPVRKAFQRSSIYDTQDILRTLTHLSLGYPDVAFRLISDKKTLLDLTPKSLQDRAKELLGHSANHAQVINTACDGIQVQGLLFSANDHRHNRMGQYLLLNHRPIFSSIISQAVKEGYGHSLPEGRYPQFVLNVKLDPKVIDVNVHPQKREARFRSKGSLSYNITTAVQESLFKQRAEIVPKETSFSKMCWDVEEEPTFFTSPQKEIQPVFFQESVPLPKIIATLEGYLIIEEGGLKIVDVPLAFEHLFKMKQYPKSTPIPLLIPIEMEASHEILLSLDEINPLLKDSGFDITPFSQKSILIHSIPNDVKEKDIKDLVRELFHLWKEDELTSRSVQILGRRKLGFAEAQYLLEKLREFPSKHVIFPLTTELLDRVKYAIK